MAVMDITAPGVQLLRDTWIMRKRRLLELEEE
jgi:hypothetical protein